MVKILVVWEHTHLLRLISNDLEEKILNKIIKPTLKGLSNLGTEYKGFLYAGLMIVKMNLF